MAFKTWTYTNAKKIEFVVGTNKTYFKEVYLTCTMVQVFRISIYIDTNQDTSYL